MRKWNCALTKPLVYWLNKQSGFDAVLIKASVICFGPRKSGYPWAKLKGWYFIPNAVYSFLITEIHTTKIKTINKNKLNEPLKKYQILEITRKNNRNDRFLLLVFGLLTKHFQCCLAAAVATEIFPNWLNLTSLRFGLTSFRFELSWFPSAQQLNHAHC